MPSASTLGEVLDVLMEKQVHRVVVISSSNKPIDLLEFGDIVKFVFDSGMAPISGIEH